MRVLRNVVGLLVLCFVIIGAQTGRVAAFDPYCTFTPIWEVNPPPQRYTEYCTFATCEDAFDACDAFCNQGISWLDDFSCDEAGDDAYGVCTCSWPHGR